MVINIQLNGQENMSIRWLKTDSRHDADFVVIGGTGGCHNVSPVATWSWRLSVFSDVVRYKTTGKVT